MSDWRGDERNEKGKKQKKRKKEGERKKEEERKKRKKLRNRKQTRRNQRRTCHCRYVNVNQRTLLVNSRMQMAPLIQCEIGRPQITMT